MTVLDSGHLYQLAVLDGSVPTELRFVKREGVKFPGNVGAYSGTTTQEVIRALIDRTQYVHNQIQFPENEIVIGLLRHVLWTLESRAAKTHGRFLKSGIRNIEIQPTCVKCGHIECEALAEEAGQ